MHQIVENVFPPVPLLSAPSSPLQKPTSILPSQPEDTDVKPETSTADKENTVPSASAGTIKIEPPKRDHRGDDSSSEDSYHSSITPGTVPPDILKILNSIIKTLTTSFPTHPPHTIQRLAELILKPKAHYRHLPAYLHALDRVVHVTSSAHVYPLPAAIPDAAGAKILINGVTDAESISWGNSAQGAHGFGSDESLGGALLTPIPWLKPLATQNENKDTEAEIRTESTVTIDGPNGPGGVETVSVSVNGVPSATLAGVNGETGKPVSSEAQLRAEGGVTQGELLRQEQEAGVVPVSQLQSSHPNGDGEEGEHPHARGPDAIGDEDIGPQHDEYGLQHGIKSIDVEAAVGRKVDPAAAESGSPAAKREADEQMESESKRVKDDEAMDVKHENDKTETEEQLSKEVADAMDTTE